MENALGADPVGEAAAHFQIEKAIVVGEESVAPKGGDLGQSWRQGSD